jgi:AcrR family transcriptional regulator
MAAPGTKSLLSSAAVLPASPTTPAQRARYQRVLSSASRMLSDGGAENLSMKELARNADVSFTALYRYFPSKAHVLLAISLDRYERGLERVLEEAPVSGTVTERVRHYMLREFEISRRNPHLTEALLSALADINPTNSAVNEAITDLHVRILRHVAEVGARPISSAQAEVLPIIVDAFPAATRRWLAGLITEEEARHRIEVCCLLLDAV